MGSSLPRLIAISQDPELRTHVRTIEVQDDCAINDPYNTSHPLRSSEIWPRDTNGHVLTQQIGVKTLRDILTEGSLCPENILMRDYRIASVNFAVCPETARTVDYRIHLKTSTTPEPAAALAKGDSKQPQPTNHLYRDACCRPCATLERFHALRMGETDERTLCTRQSRDLGCVLKTSSELQGLYCSRWTFLAAAICGVECRYLLARTDIIPCCRFEKIAIQRVEFMGYTATSLSHLPFPIDNPDDQ